MVTNITCKLFFSLIFVFSSLLAQDVEMQRFHICTVASDSTPGLQRLLDSCERLGIEIDVLGLGKPYRSNIEKIRYIRNYVKEMPGDDVVLFLDGYDTLVLADKEAILQKFLAFNVPFVISTERICWPLVDLADQFPISPTSFRYINSGVMIGYVKSIKHIFNGINLVTRIRSDQSLLSTYFLNNNNFFCLDYFSELSLSLFGINGNEIEFDYENKSVRCLETNSFPCIIHDNGPTTGEIYDKVYEMLFPNN